MHRLRWLILSLLVIAADQATKLWVLAALQPREVIPVVPAFNLTLVFNEGAAFSFLAGAGGWQRWLFVGVAVAVSTVLIVWLWRLKPEERLTAAGLSMVAGGAVGNLIDRLAYGRVVDFLDFYWRAWHWPAFNVADSAITVGVGLLLLEAFLPKRG
jgi:signal peptidase II